MGSCDFEVPGITNQGYHVVPADNEWRDAVRGRGPDEAREVRRAATIEAAIDERLKRERRKYI